uniref:Cyclic nucleotide-binding domain-containing protein n=1 Tax=Spongospora subterranea TaxID=70186 RepID=A0A0H5QI85_9EUKA|eukprot:CRZ01324.1 hypothetical protein [Spongospora subterranea]
MTYIDLNNAVGVGIVPRSSWQVIFSIVVLLNGVLVVAQLIGSFSSFLQVYDHGESAFKDRMHQLEQYLLKTRVPKKIRTRVIDYYRFVWNDLSGVDVNNVLRVLPDRLREDVMFSLCGSVLDRVNEIKKAPKGLRIRLSSFLIFEAYSEGSIIFETGDFAEHIYFLRRGRVDITVEAVNKSGARQSTLYDVVLPGRYFGELSVFGDERQRIMTATSKENTHLIKLSRGDFLTVLDQFPEFKQQFIDTGSTNKK